MSEPTTFLSHHGTYLNAAFGGGAEGTEINGVPVGLLTARAEVAGPDETFTIEVLNADQIALRAAHGQYVCAEGGGGATLIANRHYETPGPWETFTVTIVDDAAGAVALQSHDGRYVSAEVDGTVTALRDYPDGPGAWETWIVSAPWWHAAALPGNREPKGPVWLDGRLCSDDNGVFLALGASFFWVLRAYRDYRDRYDANMAWLQRYGFNYYRGFATVGGWPEPDGWRDAGAFMPWALELLPVVLDDAFTRYRLRCSLTLFDGEVQFPTDSEQDAYVHQVCDILLPRMHVVQDVQVANEYGPCQWDYPEGIERLRRHTRTLRERLGPHVPIGLSSRNTAMWGGTEQDVYDECHRLFDGLLPDIVTVSVNHDSREVTLIDGHWRHVRQPWERVVHDPVTGAALEPDASIDDEPMGPCSSVAAEENPSLIIQKILVGYISGRHQYTYHPDAGIWSDLLLDEHKREGMGEHVLIEDHPASPIVGAIVQKMMPKLPPTLPMWTRTRHGFADHPYAASFKQGASGGFSQIWPDGITDYGVVRAYCAYNGVFFLVALTGVQHYIDLTWTHPMHFGVFACGTGAKVQEIDTQQGGTLRVEQSVDTDFIIFGRYL